MFGLAGFRSPSSGASSAAIRAGSRSRATDKSVRPTFPPPVASRNARPRLVSSPKSEAGFGDFRYLFGFGFWAQVVLGQAIAQEGEGFFGRIGELKQADI